MLTKSLMVGDGSPSQKPQVDATARWPVFRRSAGEVAAELVIVLQAGDSITALAGFTEPLRLANEFSGNTLYTWSFVIPGGGMTRLANGLEIKAEPLDMDPSRTPMNVVLLGGAPGAERRNEIGAAKLKKRLAEWSRRGARTIAVGSGLLTALHALPMARGVVSAHWRQRRVVEELYAECSVEDTLYQQAPSLTSCAGELSAYDITLTDILCAHGRSLALRIAEALLIESVRAGDARQYRRTAGELGALNPKVGHAAALIQERMEEPVSFDEIAEIVGISRRQLERLFKNDAGCSPSVYRNRARIEHAHELLLRTDRTLIDISIATGFNNYSHFAKTYKRHFGRNPSKHRAHP